MTRRRVAAALVVALGCLLQLVAAPASAAPVTDFEPGYLISDSVMYDTATMTAATIQTFLATKGASCVPAAGSTCLKDYAETTPTRPADAFCPRAYTGTAGEGAASIIFQAATACGINPQVLLVTLQKEQGLVTASAGKPAATYSRALGFGCPDNAGGWCDPVFAGFANQVYSAAKQLKRYAVNPGSYSYRAGRDNTILFHPNTSCGSSVVYIQNQATASLYNYTPYQPNAAALAAGYASGDACSSYGNRNFTLYFRDWFGSPKQRTPVGYIDDVSSSGGSTVRVTGWAFDPDVTSAISVHVYVDGVATLFLPASGSRPDVAAAFNGKGAMSSYSGQLSTTAGDHDVCVYAIDGNGGTNVLIGCRSVTVVNHSPIGGIDVASADRSGQVRVAGWAFDPDVSAAIYLHVYVDGVITAVVPTSVPRPDVAAALGAGATTGYDTIFAASPGKHEVCVYGIDGNGGTNARLGCRTVSLVHHNPIGVVEVARDAGQSIFASGWAFDPDVSSAITIHVYLDGVPTLATTASGARPDVGAVYGNRAVSGYGAVVPATAGAHKVCLYAIDGSGDENVLLGCRDVTVAAG